MPRDLYRTHCVACGSRFGDTNVYSEAGWLETQISGLCELCFDTVADLFSKDADDADESGTERPGGGA